MQSSTSFNWHNLTGLIVTGMEVGIIKVAADEDFEKLWQMVLDTTWKLEYEHEEIYVWSKHSNNSNVKIVKVENLKKTLF